MFAANSSLCSLVMSTCRCITGMGLLHTTPLPAGWDMCVDRKEIKVAKAGDGSGSSSSSCFMQFFWWEFSAQEDRKGKLALNQTHRPEMRL